MEEDEPVCRMVIEKKCRDIQGRDREEDGRFTNYVPVPVNSQQAGITRRRRQNKDGQEVRRRIFHASHTV